MIVYLLSVAVQQVTLEKQELMARALEEVRPYTQYPLLFLYH